MCTVYKLIFVCAVEASFNPGVLPQCLRVIIEFLTTATPFESYMKSYLRGRFMDYIISDKQNNIRITTRWNRVYLHVHSICTRFISNLTNTSQRCVSSPVTSVKVASYRRVLEVLLAGNVLNVLYHVLILLIF